MAKATAYFGPKIFKYLKDLAANNDRDWFKANKARYEDEVKTPILRFIADFAPRLEKISPEFVADPRPPGGQGRARARLLPAHRSERLLHGRRLLAP
jgi:uncharacterized protein (DUF2461 family)